MYQTNMYEGLLAETVIMQGHNGDRIHAYMARPLGSGPYPGMVLLHHAPGWDEWYRRATPVCSPRLCHHLPNLYDREGHGTPEDVGAKVRAAGGIPDAQVIGDAEGARHISMPCHTAPARWASSAPAPAAARPFSWAVAPPALTRLSSAGGAEWCRPRKS